MNDEMRKEFEAVWAEIMRGDDVTGRPPTRSRINPDEYCGGAARFAWKWWQASRKAMKPIKLPKETDTDTCKSIEKEILHDGINYGIQKCKEAIQQAGYKVEE